MEGIELFFTPPDYGGNADFFKTQASYLDTSVEEYYEDYFKERLKRNAYVNTYINEVLDLSRYNADDWKEADQEINDYLDDLLVEHEEDVEILIK